jgi:hypothetical protein
VFDTWFVIEVNTTLLQNPASALNSLMVNFSMNANVEVSHPAHSLVTILTELPWL